MKTKVNCQVCGKDFYIEGRTKKTCSGRCAGVLTRSAPPKVFKEKNTGFFEWDNYPNGIFFNAEHYYSSKHGPTI